MSNEIALLEKTFITGEEIKHSAYSDTFKTSGHSYSDGDYFHGYQVLPYSDKAQVDKVVKHFGIRIPFKQIIHKGDGISTCKTCGAKYAGTVVKCKNLTWQEKNSYSIWNPGNRMVGHYGYQEVRENKLRECESSYISWDLAKEYEEQVEFFNFLDTLNKLIDLKPTDFDRYAHTLPPGAAQGLKIQYMEKNLSEVIEQLDRHLGALNQIANKMNQAGSSLIF